MNKNSNIIRSIKLNYTIGSDGSLFISASCSFGHIDDDNGLRLRIRSKKSFCDAEEVMDPVSPQGSVDAFEITKNMSFSSKVFLFKIKHNDYLSFLKIGIVKESCYWLASNIYTVKISYTYDSIVPVIHNIYNRLLNRDADPSGINGFIQLIKNKAIRAEEIASIIMLSDEYLSMSLDNKNIDILVECPANRCDGYGNSAHYLCEELSRKTTIKVLPTVLTNDVSDLFRGLIINNSTRRLYHPKKYLFFSIPDAAPNIKTEAEKYILTMFESTKIPSSWPNAINSSFKELIVPSAFCKDIFHNNGITIPINITTLGVDPNMWPVCNRNIDTQKFRFLLFANAHWENTRKNYQLTLDAFVKAFGDNQNVELIVKLTQPTTRFDNFRYKNVKFIFDIYDHNKMLGLIGMSNCLVFASNGEGFGLPPREAMSTGMPVILMNWSSLSEICKEDMSFWINPRRLQKAIYPDSLRPLNNGSSDFGEFAYGDVDDLADVMKFVSDNRDLAAKKGVSAAAYIRQHETYDICSNRLLDIMNLKES